MGQLVEQTLPSLFNGVSRQPHSVRLPNQFEDATDALFSVVSGGFEKRPASVNVASIGLDTTKAWKVSIGERTVDDRYVFCINEDGDIRIFDIDTGAEQTVNAYAAGLRTYLTTGADVSKLEIVSREDYTFIVNKTVVPAMGAIDSSAYVGTVEKFSDLPGLRDYPQLADAWRVNNGGVQSDDEYWEWKEETTTGTAYDDLSGTPRQIDGPTPTGNFTGWVKRYTGSGFPAEYKIVGESRTRDDIPGVMAADPSDTDVWKVANSSTQDDDYYVRWDATLEKWIDTADPFITNTFDETTMPHALVRNVGGDFTLNVIAWNDRTVGNAELVPEPPFIGKEIQDLYFYKNRLGVIADDKIVLTQSGDLFNFWPDSAVQVLDSDPIDRTGNARTTVKFRYAIPFRKTLFATADTGQFELSSLQLLTPKDASLDYVTGYKSSSICRPVTMGDELYFTTSTQGRGVVLEYFYDDNTISNTAAEITKHVGGYVLPEVTKMSTDPTTGSLWALSSGNTTGMYTYITYWDGDEKVQSAWNFWDLKATSIYDFEFLGTYVYVITRRGTDTFIERISPVREDGLGTLPFNPLLNCRSDLTGTYDAGANTTTWTCPFPHGGVAEVVLDDQFTGQEGKRVPISDYDVGGYDISAVGDFSASTVHAGIPYEMTVELSRQYTRNEQGSAIITGRLQLKTMLLAYTETSFFKVEKTPKARTTRTYTFTGRKLGDVNNIVGAVPITEGVFKFPVNSNAATVQIVVKNDSPYPSVITSGQWVGFYNNISEQDKA